MDNFLPTDYELPKKSSGYMKWEQGENRFRILSSPLIGMEAWTEDKKVTRKPLGSEWDLAQYRKEPKLFWSLVVWNYNHETIQILNITQYGILKELETLCKDKDWGNPKEYDIKVHRKGKDMNDTEYTVTAVPHMKTEKLILDAFVEANVELEALMSGDDPFKNSSVMAKSDEEVKASDLPF